MKSSILRILRLKTLGSHLRRLRWSWLELSWSRWGIHGWLSLSHVRVLVHGRWSSVSWRWRCISWWWSLVHSRRRHLRNLLVSILRRSRGCLARRSLNHIVDGHNISAGSWCCSLLNDDCSWSTAEVSDATDPET